MIRSLFARKPIEALLAEGENPNGLKRVLGAGDGGGFRLAGSGGFLLGFLGNQTVITTPLATTSATLASDLSTDPEAGMGGGIASTFRNISAPKR